MSSQFRATTPDDAEAITKLMRHVFNMPAGHPMLARDQMHWKYWRDIPEWSGSRSFVSERDGAMVAHGAVVPLTCIWGGQRLRMVNLIDWAARKQFAGAGITLLKRIGQMVDGIFVAGGTDATRSILPALGFKIIGNASRFMRPARLFARLPDAVHSQIGAARFARNVLFAAIRGPSGRLAEGWQARRITPTELDPQVLSGPCVSSDMARFERTPSAIAYLLDCPAAPGELFLVERRGLPAGYFVLSIAAKQCRIAECSVNSDDPADWQALFQLAFQRAKEHSQVGELAAVANRVVEIDAFKHSGFRKFGEVPLQSWLRRGSPPPSVRYQLADGDAVFLHEGI